MIPNSIYQQLYPESLINRLVWQGNSKLLFETGISMMPSPVRLITKSRVFKDIVRQVGGALKVSEDMVIAAFKRTVPQPALIGFLNIAQSLRTCG